MKTITTVMLAALCSAQLKGTNKAVISLGEAVEKRIVTGSGRSLGGHQGYCVELTLKNTKNAPVTIAIEAGRRLKAFTDSHQDILIVKQETVNIPGNKEVTVRVNGYCCERNDASPPVAAKYSLHTMADEGLVALATHIDTSSYNASDIQYAVWNVASDLASGLLSGGASDITPLRRVVAAIKGEELPWYEVSSSCHTFRSGRIQIIRHAIRGPIPYTLPATGYVTCMVLDEQNKPVGVMRSDWLHATTSASYDFEMPVKNLPEGKYAVVLRAADGSDIASRKFEL